MPVSCILASFLIAGAARSQLVQPSEPLLVILTDTGATRDGLPVFRQHPDSDRYVSVLSRGFSGRVLRLYAWEQRSVHPEAVQPAYLCLTDNQGGFPRTGFVLNDRRYPGVQYVDLHRRSAVSGRFGAIDQIFPHELLHIVLRDLAGELPDGPASQVHAVGVTTDRRTALNEGFAEHAQVMAIDDTDAISDTSAIARDGEARDGAFARFAEYRRALTARWSLAPRARLTFPFWFSQSEQVLRYHAVRANLFAHEPASVLRSPRSGYDAYLLDNTLPGDPDSPRKPLARLISTEGVVSALFVRWLTSSAIQRVYVDDAFYAQYGVRGADVEPLDNAYLKLFAALREGSRDVLSLARVYSRLFPQERESLGAVVRDVLGTSDLDDVPQVWVADADTPHGLSLFDQFRAVRRIHTFDLNAASAADLIGIAGMDARQVHAVLANAPYSSIDDLRRVQELSPDLRARFAAMESQMRAIRTKGVDDEGALSMRTILMPYVWHAVAALALCTLAAALIHRRLSRAKWWRAALNGVAAATVGLLVGWSVDPGSGELALAIPLLMFGLPAAAWRAWRTRSWRAAAVVLAAWIAASCIPALVVRPIG